MKYTWKIAVLSLSISMMSYGVLAECIPTPAPVWFAPAKSAIDIPVNAAFMVGVPMGSTANVVIGEEVNSSASEGAGAYIYPMTTLQPNSATSGYLELGLGGSTVKKIPFQFETGNSMAQEANPEPAFTGMTAMASTALATTSTCENYLQTYFCDPSEYTTLLRATAMETRPFAWAVTASDSDEWILLPGVCDPQTLSTLPEAPSTCMDVVAIGQSGSTSLPQTLCLGDVFPNLEKELTANEQEATSAAGCQFGEKKNVPILLFSFLVLLAWGRRRTTGIDLQ